jgi:LacI family transcriptional regulator
MIDGWVPKSTSITLPVKLVVRDSVKILNSDKQD